MIHLGWGWGGGGMKAWKVKGNMKERRRREYGNERKEEWKWYK